jgi:DNA-binding transcriptional ArsR family regulator
MPYKVSIDLKVLNDAELIELVRETQEQIEAHGEWNELNVLLRDLTAELVKRRVLSRAQFAELMELSPPE